MFTAQKCVLGPSPDSTPPHFVRVFKSVMSPIMPFKNELGHTRTLVVGFGDQITRIYQSLEISVAPSDLEANYNTLRSGCSLDTTDEYNETIQID